MASPPCPTVLSDLSVTRARFDMSGEAALYGSAAGSSVEVLQRGRYVLSRHPNTTFQTENGIPTTTFHAIPARLKPWCCFYGPPA